MASDDFSPETLDLELSVKTREELRTTFTRLLRRPGPQGKSPEELMALLSEFVEDIALDAGWAQYADGSWLRWRDSRVSA